MSLGVVMILHQQKRFTSGVYEECRYHAADSLDGIGIILGKSTIRCPRRRNPRPLMAVFIHT